MSLDYWAKALECEDRAEETADPDLREFFRRLRDSWIRAANHRELLEEAKGDPRH